MGDLSEPNASEQPMTVMLHPAIVPAFRLWLASNGLRVGRLPLDLRVSVESEPVWIVTPEDRVIVDREDGSTDWW